MVELKLLILEYWSFKTPYVDKFSTWNYKLELQKLQTLSNTFSKTQNTHLDTHSNIGMTTGRVRTGFFHTRTQPVGQDPWLGPAPFRVPGFFLRPGPAPAGPHGPREPRLGIGPESTRALFIFYQDKTLIGL